MRLSIDHADAIVKSIRRLDPDAEIWLYGSRADDELRGGDIDLFVISDNIDFSKKIDALVAIKTLIGDQRVDLHVSTRLNLRSDPLASVLRGAVRLDSKQNQ